MTHADDLTRIGRAINRIYKTVTSSLGIQLSRRTTVQETVTQGVSTVVFSDVEKIYNVYNRAITPYKKLDEFTVEELREEMPFTAGDLPTKWALDTWDSDDITILINCVPQTAFTLYADVISVASTLSGLNEPAFPESYHDILKYGVLVDEYDKLEKIQLSEKAEKKYEKRLSDLRMWAATSPHRDIYQSKAKNTRLSSGSGSSSGSGVDGTSSYTQTGLITFDRDPSAPFAVTVSSAVVPNLDADKLDGQEGSYYTTAANLTGALPAISGANLTNLNATNLASGTVADARLSSNVPLEDGVNTFTAVNTFSAAPVFSAGAKVAATQQLFLDGGGNSYLIELNPDEVRLVVGGNTVLQGLTTYINAPNLLYVNESANASQTTGLTINQAAADDEIISLKSSDVAHGVTNVTETDTYARVQKANATNGGVILTGIREDNGAGGVHLQSIITGAADATKSTSAEGVFEFIAQEKSGAGVTTVTANGNLAVFKTDTTTRFILDADGDSHQDVGTAWTNFDSHDDLAVLDSLSIEVSRPDDPWKDAIRQNMASSLDELIPRETMKDMKLVQFNEDGHHFVNMSKLAMLHTGAIRQLGRKTKELQNELNEVRQLKLELAELKRKLLPE
jgi:hypothetical protein